MANGADNPRFLTNCDLILDSFVNNLNSNGRVVTRYIFSSLIPNFSPKFGSLIPKMWQYLIPDPTRIL